MYKVLSSLPDDAHPMTQFSTAILALQVRRMIHFSTAILMLPVSLWTSRHPSPALTAMEDDGGTILASFPRTSWAIMCTSNCQRDALA